MKPEAASNKLLSVTRAKAKMYEFDIPDDLHIRIEKDPARLFSLAIGLLGDAAVAACTRRAPEDPSHEGAMPLRFASIFFEAYRQSRLPGAEEAYLLLLASASFYLAELPGSAAVLSRRFGSSDCASPESALEAALRSLIRKNTFSDWEGFNDKELEKLGRELEQIFRARSVPPDLYERLAALRERYYGSGSPREVLLVDVLCAVLIKKLQRASWNILPAYSGLSKETWLPILSKSEFVQELWPAQILLGKSGFLRGASGAVQMPTSAGKTRGIELIIRSSFLRRGSHLVVVVTPFRALCEETKNTLLKAFDGESIAINDFSDVIQLDIDLDSLVSITRVVVSTPEKLLYVLRRRPELASQIGLVIYDEGHQFDNNTRGVEYELLVSALKALLPASSQTVLISAVFPNVQEIAGWFVDGVPEIAQGEGLLPMERTVAFLSWTTKNGFLHYVDAKTPDNDMFFVPRLLEQRTLPRMGRERKPRKFPSLDDVGSIAIDLAIKAVRNGSVAVFCGTKRSAENILGTLAALSTREPSLVSPILQNCDEEEVRCLSYLCGSHFGRLSVHYRCALVGAYGHHGAIPHGMRLAIEHALKGGLIRLVVCTSTLAQGVNLPIRYLIVTSLNQGRDTLQVRDFHNLMGRAGRAGMHTEGTIIFADPKIYDRRHHFLEGWKWRRAKELLDPAAIEGCSSSLLKFFEDSSGEGAPIVEFVSSYLKGEFSLISLDGHSRENRDGAATRLRTIHSIESFLMAHWVDSVDDVESLVKGTLAHALANEATRIKMLSVFKALWRYVADAVPERRRIRIMGTTLLGVDDSKAISEWTELNLVGLRATTSDEQLLDVTWPLILKIVRYSGLERYQPKDEVLGLAKCWINGASFEELLRYAAEHIRVKAGKQQRKLKLSDLVALCEGTLGFDVSLVIGGVVEFAASIDLDDGLVGRLRNFQKRLKYGLASMEAVCLYEAGFSDRVVSKSLSAFCQGVSTSPEIKSKLMIAKHDVETSISKFPSYYREQLVRFLNS